MSATYARITRDEMTRFLGERGFSEMKVPGTRELVMGKRVAGDLSLRVYTSIRNGAARSKGADAIRVCLYCWDGGPVCLGSMRRVNRVETWRRNLSKRLDAWRKLLAPRRCPRCSARMRLVDGRNGKFWGCVRYHTTKCRGTVNH